jgi:hypothetical protein
MGNFFVDPETLPVKSGATIDAGCELAKRENENQSK